MTDLPNIDKLTETYTLRIPEITKSGLDHLPPPLKNKLNNEILLTMARVIHNLLSCFLGGGQI